MEEQTRPKGMARGSNPLSGTLSFTAFSQVIETK